jgi:rubredoxin
MTDTPVITELLIVLNDDSLICVDCWEETKPSDAAPETDPGNVPFGHAVNGRCKRCNGECLVGRYHPDPEINAEVAADVLEAERADLAAGAMPRRWQCPDCGAEHSRGHFGNIGNHRCLGCGYAGPGGVMLDD